MAGEFSLETVFFGEEEAEKVGPGSRGRACGGRGCLEGVLADEELEVSEEERAPVGVNTTPAVLSFPEEKEGCGPVHVVDGSLVVRSSLAGGVEGLEERDSMERTRVGGGSCFA